MGHSKRTERGPSVTENSPPISRELIELAALFVAAGVADLFTNTVAHNRTGPTVLVGLGVLLVASAVLHRWWRHRPRPRKAGSAPPRRPAPGRDGDGLTAEVVPSARPESRVWRVRTTVSDTPGRLASLAAALAAHQINIVSVQVNPITDGAVDDFLLRAPLSVSAEHITAAIDAGGGAEVLAQEADLHELVDLPTRVLQVAAEAVSAGADLPRALQSLFGECTVTWLSGSTGSNSTGSSSTGSDSTGSDAADSASTLGEVVDGLVLRVTDPEGGLLILERPSCPFTPVDLARVRAVLELDQRLAERIGTPRTTVSLAPGGTVSVRRGRRADAEAVLAMHRRCGAETRRRRYLGADMPSTSTVERLLSRRHGQALIAESPDGELVALANLLWDGEVAEVALLVEDRWQRRGIGHALLTRLLELADDGATRSVYAVVSAGNEPMIELMRRLGAQLSGIEFGAVCLTIDLPARVGGVVGPGVPIGEAQWPYHPSTPRF